MKTTTLFWAYVGAVRNVTQGKKAGKDDWERYSYYRQMETLRSALLRRIEEGDRAREALKEVEWTRGYNQRYSCPWCHGYDNHAQDCPRQIALGIEP